MQALSVPAQVGGTACFVYLKQVYFYSADLLLIKCWSCSFDVSAEFYGGEQVRLALQGRGVRF